jgi:uncharacterized membrane protein
VAASQEVLKLLADADNQGNNSMGGCIAISYAEHKAMCWFPFWSGWCPVWIGGMWFVPFLLVILFVVGMFFCGRMCCGRNWMPWPDRGDRNRGADSPLDIAKRRLAKGEITKEEYEDLKRVLA